MAIGPGQQCKVGDHVTMIGSGGYFGELGPMFNLPRSASARAPFGPRS
jgi:CRP-like cAMP-binding protein